jgi:hypothetical protein
LSIEFLLNADSFFISKVGAVIKQMRLAMWQSAYKMYIIMHMSQALSLSESLIKKSPRYISSKMQNPRESFCSSPLTLDRRTRSLTASALEQNQHIQTGPDRPFAVMIWTHVKIAFSLFQFTKKLTNKFKI